MLAIVDEQKRAFAAALFRQPDLPYMAAGEVTDDAVERYRIATTWPNDPDVLAFLNAIGHEPVDVETENLPSRGEFVRLMWEKLHEEGLNGREFAAVAKVYADARGYTKAGEGGATATNVNVKVMVQERFGSDDQWERDARARQRDLVTSGTAVE